MAEMGIYETMRTLRAVRRLRPDPRCRFESLTPLPITISKC